MVGVSREVDVRERQKSWQGFREKGGSGGGVLPWGEGAAGAQRSKGKRAKPNAEVGSVNIICASRVYQTRC